MRLVRVLAALCGHLMLGNLFSDEILRRAAPDNRTKDPRVCNPRLWGSGDDATDNTKAFSECLQAVVAAGGGRMHLPDGIYRDQIVIPAVAQGWVNVEISNDWEAERAYPTTEAR